MKRLHMIGILVLSVLFLTACSRIQQEILYSVYQETEQTRTDSNENWEEEINYRYEWAIVEKDMELLKDCIAEGADYNDMNGLSPVFLSYIQENYLMAEYLLSLGASPRWNDNKGTSILHQLTKSDTYEECKTLLSYGADVNYIDKKGMTEIEFAASNQMAGIDVLQLLIDYGAKVTPKTVEIAFEAGNRECDLIRFLVNELQKSNTKSELTPIVEYAIMGKTENVKGLVKSEYKRLSTKEKEHVLKFTGAYGSVDTLKEILKVHLNIEESKWILAESAIESGNLEVIRYLVDNDMLDINDNERYPLTTAIQANQQKVVEFFVSLGADVNLEAASASNIRGITISGNVDILELLIKSGYKIEDNNAIYYLTEDAAINNKMEILYYIDKNYELNRITNSDMSIVDMAGMYDINILKFFLQRGIDVNGLENSGFPLSTCIEYNNTANALYMIENGADVNIFCDGTYLMKAVRNGNFDIVKALVEHGADINAQDYGFYPIVQSASGRTILKYLIESGAEIDIQNIKSGKTALMVAADSGNVEGVKLLLEAGADKSIKNKNGQTAYDIAKDRNHVKCMELLSDSESNQ